MKVLIVYGTTKGYTAKVAGKIAQIIRDGGDETEVVEGRSVPADLAFANYAGVIIGASVTAGRFQRYIVDFVMMHRDEIQRLPSAFFSVSLTEADVRPKRHARAMHTVSRFLKRTGWKPDAVASFAGSIAYMRYRWLMRLFWRYVPLPDAPVDGRSGGVTDDDYAFTDWEAVNRFTMAFVAVAKRRAPQSVRPASTQMETVTRAHGSIAI